MRPLLTVENLTVSFDTYAGEVEAVRDVSFTLDRGEVLAIVGESGSGKSVTVQSLLGLTPTPSGARSRAARRSSTAWIFSPPPKRRSRASAARRSR